MEPSLIPYDRKILEGCSEKSISALEGSMVSLEAGTPPTPSFKLYGKTDISVATDFLSTLRKDRYPEWMLNYEETRLEKFGPQGGHAPWVELKDDFMLYQERLTDVKYVDQQIISEMKRAYQKLNISKMSAQSVLSTLINEDKILDRAAGWRTFNLKKTDKLAQNIALADAKSGRWKDGYAYVFSRYNKLKKRIFMPMPFSSMIVQAQYFVPFLKGIQKSLESEREHSPYVFWADKIGFDKAYELFTAIWQTYSSQLNRYIPVFVQRDFEKMDTTTGTSQYQNFFIPMVNAASHKANPKDVEEIMLFTTRAPIITPSGIMIGDHGTASGAEVTNGGETVCNDYYARRLDKCLHKAIECITVLQAGNGDDGWTVYLIKPEQFDKFKETLSSLAETVAAECGFRVQGDKWHISKEFGIYCQEMNWIEDDNIKHAYPATLILNSIVNPEREYTKSQWDKDYRDIDVCVKLDNGRHLPYYHELVDYVQAGMKYPLLGSTEQETKRILSKYDRYRELQSLQERFNRQDYEFSKSPTVNYLLSKR